jgi:hypothetical protein
VKIKSSHLCRCGHRAAAHTVGVFPTFDSEGVSLEVILENTYPSGCYICACKQFELNNLDLIEYLAEQRGLI